MANIQKRADGAWRARYRDEAGKEHARHFQRKTDAQRWLDEVTTATNTGMYVDPKRTRTLFAVVAEGWLATGAVSWKATTKATNAGILRVHVLPRWGQVPVGRIEHDAVQTWVAGMVEAGMKPRTIRKIYFVLSGVMKHAVKSKLIAVPPTIGVELPSAEAVGVLDEDVAQVRRYLEPVEVERLAEAAGDGGQLVILALAYTGLRWGELAALRVGDVNVVRSRLSVSRSVTEISGRLVWSTPKDKKKRSIPVPAFLLDELQVLMRDRAPEELLFTSPRGDVLRVRSARRAWFDRAVAAVGLTGFTPHALRHTAASLAVHAGANVLTVQRMLGHKRPSITLDVYSDLFDGDLDEVAGHLERVRAGAAADFLRTRADSGHLRAVR